MAQTRRLGELQLAIMRVLWARGEATVAQVHRELTAERGLAPTTIATMLTKMERKGIVAHRSEQRRFVYRPTVEESEVNRSMVQQLVDQLFAGDRGALVHHLLTQHDIESDELSELRRLIDEQAPQGGESDDR